MAGFWTTIPSFMDLLEEEVACRSGVLLADQDLRELAMQASIQLMQTIPLDRTTSHTIRLRGEEIEACIVGLRATIGNLPDSKSGMAVAMDNLRLLADLKVDIKPIADALHEALQSNRHKTVDKELIDEIARVTGYSKSVVVKVFLAIGEWQQRSPTFLWPAMSSPSSTVKFPDQIRVFCVSDRDSHWRSAIVVPNYSPEIH